MSWKKWILGSLSCSAACFKSPSESFGHFETCDHWDGKFGVDPYVDLCGRSYRCFFCSEPAWTEGNDFEFQREKRERECHLNHGQKDGFLSRFGAFPTISCWSGFPLHDEFAPTQELAEDEGEGRDSWDSDGIFLTCKS